MEQLATWDMMRRVAWSIEPLWFYVLSILVLDVVGVRFTNNVNLLTISVCTVLMRLTMKLVWKPVAISAMMNPVTQMFATRVTPLLTNKLAFCSNFFPR